MSDWISVEERLPESDDDVFLVEMDAISTYGYPYQYSDAVEKGFFSEDKWYLSDWDSDRYNREDFHCENVPQRQHLPEPLRNNYE